MKSLKFPACIFIYSFFFTTFIFPQISGDFKSNGSGNWNDETKWLRYDGSSWSQPATGHYPGATGEGGSVTILNGHTVTINISTVTNLSGLTIGEGTSGILQFDATGPYTFRVEGNITINDGGTFMSANSGTETGHILRMTGNFINFGTLDFSTNSNTAGVDLTFSSSNDQSFSGYGITDIRTITVDKSGGGLTHYVDIQTNNLTIKGSNTDNSGFLTMTNGGCRIKGTYTLSSVLFQGANYTLNPYSVLELHNPNFTLIGNINDFTVEGGVIVYDGNINFGNSANAKVAVAGGRFAIYGGTVNIAGNLAIYFWLNSPIFTMSNGVLNIATIGYQNDFGATIYTLGSINNKFYFYGGIINLVHQNTGTAGDINLLDGEIIYGGTIRIGTGATPENSTFKIKGSLPNIVVDNTTYSKNLTIAGNTTVNNNLEFGSGTLKLESGTLTTIGNISVGNNATIDRVEGTLSKAPTFGTSVNIIYSGTTAVTSSYEFPSSPTLLNNLTINNPAGVNISVFTTVNESLNLLSGSLSISGLLTLVNNTTVTRSAGTLTALPNFGANVNIVYSGSTGISTSYEMPSSTTVLKNLTINNTGGVTLTQNTTVNGNLYLTSGLLTTGGYLTIADGKTIERSGGSLSALPTFGSTVKITYSGTTALTTSYELPTSTSVLSDLKIDNLGGVNLAQDITVNGSLILNNGVFSIGNNTLTLNGNVTAGSGSLSGGTTSNINATSSSTFNLPQVELNNLTINKTNNVNLTGDVNINGTLYLTNGTLTTNNALFMKSNSTINRSDGGLSSAPIFLATVNIIYTGSNPVSTSHEIPISTSVLSNLEINNSAGITLTAAVSTSTLTLTNGIINSDAINVLTIKGSSTAAITGGSSSSYIKGPLVRTIPNNASNTTYIYPLGKSSYKPFEIAGISTSGSGNATFKAEVFDENCGGTTGSGLTSLNSNRYWKMSANLGSVSISAFSIRLTESGLTSTNKIAQCNTLSGSYSSRGGSISGNTLLSTTDIDLSNVSSGTFFVVGTFDAITKTVGGTGGADYTTLKLAFDAINSGSLTGYIILEIISNTTESAAATLNANGSGSSSYTTVLIYPTSSGITITGNISGPVIDLYGADNVIIDGKANRTGSNTDLTIANTNSGNSNALKFGNDASNNLIEYCKFKTSSNTTDSYVIFFNNPVTLGNNNNYIQYCEVFGETNYPTSTIYSLGNSSAVNSGNVISHCKIHDFGNFGVNLGAYNNNWRIDTNYIYQVNSSASSTQQCISLSSTECLFQIKGNIIGGSSSDGSGTWINSAASSIYPMYIQSGNTSSTNYIQNNLIKNFSQTSTGTVYFVGIHASSAGKYNISSNEISNISQPNTTSTSTYTGIGGVYFGGTTDGVSISSNSIHDLSSRSQRNMTIISTTASSLSNISLFGILSASSAANQIISQNTIYNLNATYNSTVNFPCVSGIAIDEQSGATGCEIKRNKIYGLTNNSIYYNLGTTPGISGLRFYSASTNTSEWNVSNNQICLTNGVNTNSLYAIGICYIGGAAIINANYNTIYIGGSVSANARHTYCVYSRSSSVNPTLYNNILYMGRTGGTAKYYSIYLFDKTVTSNYNLLVSSSLSTIGYYSADKTFDGWKTATSQDYNSWSDIYTNIPASDLFTDISNGNLNIKTDQPAAWYVNGKGNPTLTNINTDLTGNTRSTSITSGATDIGANEFTPSSTPPAATETGSRTNGGTTYYYFGGQILASITWGSGTLPGLVNVRYYSNVQISSPSGNYGNGYWDVTVDVQPSSTYSITFYFGDHETYSIVNPSNSTVNLAKYSGGIWTNFPNGTIGNNNVSITSYTYNPHTVTVNGISSGFSQFALSDNNSPLPVNILSFNSRITNLRDVELKWDVENESNMNGYEIHRRLKGNDNWLKVGNLSSQNRTERTTYNYNDKKLNTGIYQYRIKHIDNNGNFSFSELSNPVEISVPTKFELSQNYPNPFNPKTKIDFNLPIDSKIELKVFDVTGKEVAYLIKGEYLGSGYYTTEVDGNQLASGTYFYRIFAKGSNRIEYIMTRKMLLVK